MRDLLWTCKQPSPLTTWQSTPRISMWFRKQGYGSTFLDPQNGPAKKLRSLWYPNFDSFPDGLQVTGLYHNRQIPHEGLSRSIGIPDHLLNVRYTVGRIHTALPVQIACPAMRVEYSVHNFIPTIFRMQCYDLLSWGVECSWMSLFDQDNGIYYHSMKTGQQCSFASS